MAINLPEKQLPNKPYTVEDMRKVCSILDTRDDRTRLATDELEQAFAFIKSYPKSVSFFGSSHSKENDKYYERARDIASRIVKELGYVVVTGAGPGIMEAANRGAKEAGGRSIGFNIELPQEQATNPYVTESLSFHYFFTRKVSLSFSAEAYIFFPGGLGTMDELFELATLVQTHKIDPVPIILVGDGYWKALESFMKEHMLEAGMIDEEDLDIYTITDDEDEVISIVKSAPLRKE
ncbi:MAG: TIGR00730 family Rossman fold protein [bacterium]|nr:TIGR00730 family Rossman fold protein [bacterium]MDZ4231883.1 TIGR00730 family Rossman fold protein [Candidatus Pacearchaeota archaeon]